MVQPLTGAASKAISSEWLSKPFMFWFWRMAVVTPRPLLVDSLRW